MYTTRPLGGIQCPVSRETEKKRPTKGILKIFCSQKNGKKQTKKNITYYIHTTPGNVTGP
jgi:hypothetical protein